MTIGSFLKYVEIQTKVASFTPFLLGTALAVYRYRKFNIGNFFIMLISLLAIDMATTAINNYIDYKRARKKSGYGYETHNAIVRDNLRESSAIAIIVVLLSVAVLFGLLLFFQTNIIVVLLGAVSFAVGILYSFGPVPISRTPFGEIFSGIFMGFLIPFLSLYVHIYDTGILTLGIQNSIITLQLDWPEIVSVFLITFPATVGIANIMLANNICDMEDDRENCRYTLPLYIGKESALRLFKVLYFAAYAAVIPAFFIKTAPLVSILFFATIIPVLRNIHQFEKLQTKKDTFVLSVQNFMIMNVALVITIFAGTVLQLV